MSMAIETHRKAETKKLMKRREAAVSPVVGVMLMLVVTIVIAAVVSVFASGVITSTEKAPVAMLQADAFVDGSNGGDVYLSSLSGESIDLTKVVVKVFNEAGTDSIQKWTLNDGVGTRYLESGCTIDLAKYMSTDSPMYITDNDDFDTDKVVEIAVVYDGTHMLYDQKVKVL